MTDAELLAAYRNGDEDAFAVVMTRHKAPLFTFILGMVRDEGSAADIFQETFLRVVKNIARYEERGMFKAWLFATARNLAMDHFRREGHGPLSLDAPTENEDGATTMADSIAAPTAHGPEPSLETKEDREMVLRAIAELPADMREVLLMREYSGMSFKEIAAALDIPIGTALARMSRAVAKLRKALCTPQNTKRI